jgi:hypothetical protein
MWAAPNAILPSKLVVALRLGEHLRGLTYVCLTCMPSAAACRRMFHDLDDTTMSCVNLSDSAARVACLVNHMYGGSGYVISSDSLLDCACVADKYDMPHLDRAVDTFVQQLQLTVYNVAGFMAVAHECPGLWELKHRCIEYTAKRLQHILDYRCHCQHVLRDSRSQHGSDCMLPRCLPASCCLHIFMLLNTLRTDC